MSEISSSPQLIAGKTSIAVFEGEFNPQSDLITTPEMQPSLLGLPTTIADLLQEVLSSKRISGFLNTSDVEYFDKTNVKHEATPQAGNISINGTVTWEPTFGKTKRDLPPDQFQLQDLNIQFPRGEMTLITGKFAAGKTLLLLALLGEARLIEGKISYLVSTPIVPGCANEDSWAILPNGVAYAPQVSLNMMM